MIFEVHGIKALKVQDEKTGVELDPINIPVDFLIDCGTETEVREKIKTIGIVLLALKSYKEGIDKYGSIYAKIDIDKNDYNVLLKFATLEEGYSFLIETLGVKVKYINSRVNKIPDEKIYEFLQQQYDLEKGRDEDKDEKEKNKVVEDKKIIALRAMIVDLIEEAVLIIEKTKNKIYPDLSRKLLGSVDLLKRYRWSYNTEMMSKCIELTLKYMEMAEINFLEKTKYYESSSVKDDTISDLDIVKEYEKYKTSKKAFKSSKLVGKIKMDKDQQFYTFFGKMGIYMKIFLIDVFKRISSIKINFSSFVKLTQIFIVFCIINLSIYYVYNIFNQNSEYNYSIYYFISFFGLLGFLTIFFGLFKKDSAGFLILFFFGLLMFFSILRYLVILIFAI